MAAPQAAGGGSAATLAPEQVRAMFENCLKLATENKITARNTWSLGLIDYMSDLVKGPEGGEGGGGAPEGTNFQRASVTLDAGVKIYGHRVDSVHSSAFHVLGGLSRGGPAPPGGGGGGADGAEGDDSGAEGEEDGESSGRRAPKGRRRGGEGLNPSATLEAPEALNAKKFDLQFAVDPLFHKTTAQFDEGGAKGLLLANLSVLRGPYLVFDSEDRGLSEVDPLPAPQPKQLDLGSALRAEADRAVEAAAALVARPAPAPGLAELLELLRNPPGGDGGGSGGPPIPQGDELDRLVAEAAAGPAWHGGAKAAEAPGDGGDASDGGGDFGGGAEDWFPDGDAAAGGGDWDDPAEQAPAQGDGDEAAAQERPGLEESGGQQAEDQPVQVGALSALGKDWAADTNLTVNLPGAAWAGGAHWKFRTRKAAAGSNKENEGDGANLPRARRRPATKKKAAPKIDFSVALSGQTDRRMLQAPDANKRSLLLAPRRPANTLLPPDQHYEVADLYKLFHLPDWRFPFRLPGAALASGREGEAGSTGAAGEAAGEGDDDGEFGGAGDAWVGEGGYADGAGDNFWPEDYGGAAGPEGTPEGAGDLLAAPRGVKKLDITYARASKQVDVRRLKSALWAALQRSTAQRSTAARQPPQPGAEGEGAAEEEASAVEDGAGDSAGVGPGDGVSFQGALEGSAGAAGNRAADLSVHLCFICLLHLANEHGLELRGSPSLDALAVRGVAAAA